MLDGLLRSNILVWNLFSDTQSFLIANEWARQLKALYDTLDAETHAATATGSVPIWSGNIDDYELILWPCAQANPSWWTTVTGGGWTGRIHLTAENAGFAATCPYVASISGTTGIGLTSGRLDLDASGLFSTVNGMDITDGVATLFHNQASEVSGGDTIALSVGGDPPDTRAGVPWIARNRTSQIDWVVSGDSDHMNLSAPDNERFFRNLWEVEP